MLAVIAAFLLGAASGLRALAGLAVVSWAAHLGYFHLEHTWLAFLGYAVTPYILTLLAVVAFKRINFCDIIRASGWDG